MQTFLPYLSFRKSASVLDRQRLGKQRVENMQIMTALLTGRGWPNHPAVKMWRGYEFALLQYQEAICDEWRRRGYADNCYVKTWSMYREYFTPFDDNQEMPYWLGDRAFHESHQSNLIRKDKNWYEYKFPGIPSCLPYVWPEPRYQENYMPEQTLLFKNARIIFKNFAGHEREYNSAGDRNFVLCLDPDQAAALKQEGWNVKQLKGRDDEPPQDYIQVAVSFGKGRPPRCVLITSSGKTDLGADEVSIFDYADIANVDLTINPYHWNVRDESGIKAYLRTIFVTLNEDELDRKYADVPDANPTTTLSSIANDTEDVA